MRKLENDCRVCQCCGDSFPINECYISDYGILCESCAMGDESIQKQELEQIELLKG